MDVKWLGFIVALFILLQLLGATFDAQSSAAETWGPEEDTTIAYLTDFKKIVYADAETGPFTWLTPNTLYFDALYTAASWNFGFLKCAGDTNNCGYAYFRQIVLIPFTLVSLFGIAVLFITLLQGFIPG